MLKEHSELLETLLKEWDGQFLESFRPINNWDPVERKFMPPYSERYNDVVMIRMCDLISAIEMFTEQTSSAQQV